MKYTYMSFKELVMNEILEQDNATFFEDIARESITPQGYIIPSINWVDGIAFVVQPMPPTEDIVKEQLTGILRYSAVVYTKTPFKSEVTASIGKDPFPIRLRKADNNPIFVGLAKFLKDFRPSPDS